MGSSQSIPDLLGKVKDILAGEPRLIELPTSGKAIFVGDTHGDLDATRKVIDRYQKKGNTIIFLGDYIDRGLYSKENILFLLSLKLAHPDEIILLTGNHESFTIKKYSPADFWLGLSGEEKALYGSTLTKLPLAVFSKNGIIALHGALPDLDHIKEINRICPGEKSWDQITWGDFYDVEGEQLKDYTNRPGFGFDYFNRIMTLYDRSVLIRSHQTGAKPAMYNKRCLTILTSSSCSSSRKVAVVDLDRKEIKNIDDLTIEEIL